MLYSHVTLLMLRVVDVVAKTTVQQSARMLVADIPGEIQIGALFPLHRQIAGTEGCGSIWEQYGIQRTEIALETVRQINKELPFRLGISVRDSCWTERVSMEQTIAFLREGVAQCSCCQTPGCNKKSTPVVAVIGPGKSASTIAVQNLLQVFRIPQVGYAATTPDLSDKEQFSYFLRVVPSDVYQARAISKLLDHFMWTYVAVIYSAGNYGEKGFEELERIFNQDESDVCVAYSEKIKSLAQPEEFEKMLLSLDSQKNRPQVVVCFCEGETIKKIMRAQKRLRKWNKTFKPFQWIGSDSWADRMDVVEGVQEEAAGSFSIRIHSPRVESFEEYYWSLNPENNTANPWFREFWQEKFKCKFAVSKEEKNQVDEAICTGYENLTLGYEQDPKISQVMNSIRVVAMGLKAMYNEKCRDNSTLCSELLSKNGTMLYHYMLNVTYTDMFGQEIIFDPNGDPPAWYDILNYVGSEGGYRTVGEYRRQTIGVESLNIGTQIAREEIMFYDKSGAAPESVCSKPCGVGQRQRETTACCWICETCHDNQIVNHTSNICVDCELGMWPGENRTTCFALPHEYLSWTSAGSIIALLLAVIGILITLFTTLVFMRHNGTPVVKSTTRELSYIILAGIFVCYSISFAVLARPSFVSCFLTRTVPPIGFSIVYSALLTKTNRIARILAGSKKRILTKKPRFLSTFSQVVITWLLVGAQCIIVAVMVAQEMPGAGFDPAFLPARMVLICASTSFAFLVPFVWNLILIVLCTLYAVKTRNLPENFNEAKFIGFTMYCTLVVWLAFIVLHLGTMNKALTMSFSFSLSASIALALLFFPKLYIILFHPEKNVRSSYTTTKLIRCHFGNSQGAYDSKHKTRTSTQSASISGVTRTASVHVASTSSSGHGGPATDVGTQTEPASRFGRTFSTKAHRRKGGGSVDDDVQHLVDACRRYQDERLQGQEGNLLLEEEEEVGAALPLLADSMQSMRNVLKGVAKNSLAPTPEDDGFEEMEASSYAGSTPSPSSSSSCSTAPLSSPPPPLPQSLPPQAGLGVTDDELAKLSVRQLNQRLQGHDRTVVSAIKQKRRTLKNRGYALNCRVRRIQTQLQLEADNMMLRDQLRWLKHSLSELTARLQYYEPGFDLIPSWEQPVSSLPMENPLHAPPLQVPPLHFDIKPFHHQQ